jgi:hypothetical protein
MLQLVKHNYLDYNKISLPYLNMLILFFLEEEFNSNYGYVNLSNIGHRYKEIPAIIINCVFSIIDFLNGNFY